MTDNGGEERRAERTNTITMSKGRTDVRRIIFFKCEIE